MNSTTPDREGRAPAARGSLGLQFIAILAAATALGLAYNGVSPLGLRSKTPAETVAAPPSAAEEVQTAASPLVRTGYVNQTLAMALETSNERPSPAVVPPKPAAANPAPVAPMKFVELKWPEVKALLAQKKIVLVDARLKANYEVAHIPGAISLPSTSTAAELQAFATAYPKDTRFVTYCGSDTCHMSHALAESLVKICGYTNVSVMPGGFAEFTIAEPGGGTKAQ